MAGSKALNFSELRKRFVNSLRDSVRNGDMTERRLARISGVSQPHIHHVLCGKRSFSIEMADQVMAAMHRDILDFLDEGDLARRKSGDKDVVE